MCLQAQFLILCKSLYLSLSWQNLPAGTILNIMIQASPYLQAFASKNVHECYVSSCLQGPGYTHFQVKNVPAGTTTLDVTVCKYVQVLVYKHFHVKFLPAGTNLNVM